ncbi:DUF3846 domain-containing protein [Streptomyces sp. NPDC088757]|uniref:DUF3846 domain-containing protein n=1 Tax=Streptomyces sp. NPDC088757 TaxID=3365889 RepID=UPI003805B4E5
MSQTRPEPAFALLIRPSGTFRLVDWPGTPADRPNLLRAIIDCDRYDVADITADLSLWIDDEGAIVESPEINLPATAIFARYGTPHQFYFGNALFTGGTDSKGETLGLTKDKVLELVEVLMEFSNPIPFQRAKS